MGTGYTRNDTINNIADGNIINAADFDGEYDAIEATFNSSTGHSHDGTSGEGGPVTVLGPAQDFVTSTTEIKPKTTNTLDIGTNLLKFKDIYLAGTANLVDVTTTGDVTLTGAANNIVFDASDNALEFADNAKAAFGDATNPDLQIYHDGTDNYIESNAGELYIQGDGITLRSDTDTETYITMDKDGAVALYYDNSKKFETTATGVAITGSLALDGIHLDDTEKLTFGNSAAPDLEIFHSGTNSFISDTGTGSLVINGTQINIQNAANDAILAEFIQAGAVNLYHNGNAKFATDADGVNVTGQIDVSTNVNLASDGAVINLGAGADVTLTHEHNVGVQAKAASGFELNLQTGDTAVESGELLGKITFNAPDEISGTDAILDGAAIEAVAEDTFSTTNNTTALVFKTNTSGAATERMRIKGDGTIIMDTQVDIDNITIDGNTISTTDTNGNLIFATNGTGDIVINDDIISTATDQDITLTPNGTGSVDIGKLKIASGATAITSILDEDGLTSNSDTALATQQSIKAYVDSTFTGGSFSSGITVDGANIDISDNFAIDFEGASFTTTLGKVVPTAARTINLPDASGTVALLDTVSTDTVSATPVELSIVDGDTSATATTLEDADRLVANDDGTMVQVAMTDIKDYMSNVAGFSSDDPTALAIALG